ncbi:MAG TPA: hypothetical protein PKD17_08700 [Cellvibrionaceae bacterium]|nr:hypothetical protein [Cellvibrionaceae bacterium]HMW71884.1 hypothetical protein [Cellvibrionaceae bacterium]HMY39729.1 hypothetical protein [Marinagarivorans sp.]HNG61281.1 hypothetical protein [Cellvibrionaceae bacterium]
MTVYCYSKTKQAVLYLLLACLPVVGLMCFYLALNMWEAAQWFWVGLWGMISAVFLGFFFVGLRMRSFIHTGIALTEEGLEFHQGAVNKLHPWSEVGAVKSWPWIQLLVVFDAKGRVLLPVDHMLTNFPAFKQALEARLTQPAVASEIV